MKQILLFVVCILFTTKAHAIVFTVNGITYDNFSSTVYDGRYMHVRVTVISENLKGNIVIPEIPADYSGGLLYFRVTEIANRICEGRTDITSLTLPGSAKIGNSSFANCMALNSVNIVNSTYNGGIGNNSFAGCNNLSTVNISKNTTNIDNYAFSGCVNLSQIIVDEANSNYTSIDGVLYNKDCSKLLLYPCKKTGNSFTIPNSVTGINSGAFYNCNDLTTITIPAGLTGIDGSTFEGANLSHLFVDESHPDYASVDGVLYSKDRTTLVFCPSKRSGSFTVPNGTTNIGRFAFIGCSGLTIITIPSSVTYIYYNSFRLCSGLTQLIVDAANPVYTSIDGVIYSKDLSILDSYPPNKAGNSFTIPQHVTSIAKGAFMTCVNLTEIKIPQGIASIGGYAFWGCVNLNAVTIPKSVTYIGEGAFLESENLADIYVSWTDPSVVTFDEYSVFSYIKSDCKLHVPVGMKDTYLAIKEWQAFQSYIVDDVVSSISKMNKPGFQIYPDPIHKGFYVSGIDDKAEVIVTDMSGRPVLSKQIIAEEYIPLDTRPAGIYIIKVQIKEKSFTDKIVKK